MSWSGEGEVTWGKALSYQLSAKAADPGVTPKAIGHGPGHVP